MWDENDAKIAEEAGWESGKAKSSSPTRSEAMANLNTVTAEAAMALVHQLANIQTTAVNAGKTADKLATQW